MILRINRRSQGTQVIVELAGSLDVQQLDELRAQIAGAGADVVVDVGALSLVGIEGIRFLNSCEDRGIEITNASLYIREWMSLERATGSKGS